MAPSLKFFYEKVTGTLSYIVFDKPGGKAAIIDPVLDYDPKSARTHTDSADKLIECIKENDLTLEWVLETHAHADHLSAAYYLKRKLGGKIAIGARIVQVQETFKKLFNLDSGFVADGTQFDYLLHDDEVFKVGALSVRAMSVPGHTPADMAYQIDDCIFLGDTLFMPDVGTARCDFPGGDARTLYRSIRKVLSFPVQTRLFMCHDYPPDTREPRWECTVDEQRQKNIHVHDGVDEENFVAMRQKRDAMLPMPVLILPSIQVNIRAGAMPPAENNGIAYLKIPMNVL